MTNLLEVFPWHKNFETHIPLIDQQHQKISALINQLANALSDHSAPHKLDTLLNELIYDVIHHFETEEKIWQHCLTPQTPIDSILVQHKKQHTDFIETITEIKNQHQPTNNIIELLLAYLNHWLAHHIIESDLYISKIILSMQSGHSLEQATEQANADITISMASVLNGVLSMYSHLCKRTISLKKEINTRIKNESSLREAANVFENALESICITDINECVINANPAFYQSSGYSKEEVIGHPLCTIKSGLSDHYLTSDIHKKLHLYNHWRGKINNRNKNGEMQAEWLSLSVCRDSEHNIIRYISIFSNISHLIKEYSELKFNAHHDALTKLPNRLLLTARLEQAIADASRKKEQFAVCFLDLDGFKPVNDLFGHDVGDLLLCEVAKRIKNIIRGNDTVARIGGDEFVVIFNNLNEKNDCKIPLERLLTEISSPMNIKNHSHQVGVSIGVAFYPDDGMNAEILLHHSDQSMYEAKHAGKGGYKIHKKTDE